MSALSDPITDRFAFGENWSRLLGMPDVGRIEQAEKSLMQMLGATALAGKRFLDAGSGSALFSLCARRLQARVASYDYDAQSVACTAELKRRFFPGDTDWRVEQGSVHDSEYLESLGQFDLVYSWGVLHHTGAMWYALALVAGRVSRGGQLVVSIYNGQGGPSRRWAILKRGYNRWRRAQPFVLALSFWKGCSRVIVKNALSGQPLHTRKEHGRGRSPWYDLVDWAGGYPFDVAKSEEIFRFYRDGFRMTEMVTCTGGSGCNEYVFVRER